METESSPIQSPRRFRHKCGQCGSSYQLLLRVDLHTVHKAACPNCSAEHFFDNRDGRLDVPLANGDGGSSHGAGVPSDSRRSSYDSGQLPARPPARPATGPGNAGGSGQAPARPSATTSGTAAGGGGSTGNGGAYSSGGAYSGGRSSYAAPRRGHPISVYRGARRLPGFRIGSGLELLGSLRDLALGLWSSAVDFARARPAAAFVVGCGLLLIGAILPLTMALLARIPGFYLAADPNEYLARIQGVAPNLILDRNGRVLAELFATKTGNLKADQIPRSIKEKLVFVEDKHFYDHGGVHWPSVVRAFTRNLVSGGYSQGGSTLTQQLSRILLNDRSRTIFRKLRELNLAYVLEGRLKKDAILSAYINHVYLGHGAVGIETAADFYFGKKIDKLTFVEELILVSLPSAPERYSPLRNPRVLTAKLDAIFDRMEAEKFPHPTRTEFNAMKADVFRGLNRSPAESIFGSRHDDAPYVSEYVRLQIRKVLGKEYEYGAGLRIETTIDPHMQRVVRRESQSHIQAASKWIRPKRMLDGHIVVEKDERRDLRAEYMDASGLGLLFGLPIPRRFVPTLQTASIGIDPKSGDVLFLQGGVEFKSGNQLNRAIDMRRQTGSSIKPIVYSAAIESGKLTVASRLDDTPIYAKRKDKRAGRPDYWLPGNISGVYEGTVSVRRALAHSKNIPAIRVAQATGLPRLAEQFRKFFFVSDGEFQSRFRYDETIAIGSLEMSPLEMASAFSAFANNGVIRRPRLIRRIVDPSGRVLYDAKDKDAFGLGVPEERRVLPGDVAEVMASLMHDSARRGGVGRGGLYAGTFIGKTGTTNELRDAWFAGVTPRVAAVVWVGYDDPAYSLYRATGSSVAGPLWGRIIKSAGAAGGHFSFHPRAARATICIDSGLRPSNYCPNARRKEELFALGHVPEATCDVHTGVQPRQAPGPSINRSGDFE